MPFDATGFTGTEIDLGKPSVAGLAYVLRHKELWPENFIWDYGSCRTCAMGLAIRMWRECWPYNRDYDRFAGELFVSFAIDDLVMRMRKTLGLPFAKAYRIFVALPEYFGGDEVRITPEHVADALEFGLPKPGRGVAEFYGAQPVIDEATVVIQDPKNSGHLLITSVKTGTQRSVPAAVVNYALGESARHGGATYFLGIEEGVGHWEVCAADEPAILARLIDPISVRSVIGR